MKLRMIDAAVLAMASFVTPAFSQAVSAPQAAAQPGPAAAPVPDRSSALANSQRPEARSALPTRQEEAERAGNVCPNRAWPDSACQTPTEGKPK
jgi:hypothetical protein